jgi:FeS assembly SUF system protein
MTTKPVSLGTNRLAPEGAAAEQDINRMPSTNDSVATTPPLEAPLTAEQKQTLHNKIVDVLHTCFDPEIPVNIYELGLIYKIDVESDGKVQIDMTLTTPACPVAGSLPGDVQGKVQTVANVRGVNVNLVWDPPWDKSRMSEAAKLQLGIDD